MPHDMTLPAQPPYTVVIFRSLRNDVEPDAYAQTAEQMVEMAMQQPGYLGHWSARDASGRGITLSYWVDDDAARAWKAVAEHAAVQRYGAEHWYDAYVTEVATVTRSYVHEREA